MFGSRLFWAVAVGSLLVVGAVAVPVSGFLWGHSPFPHGSHGGSSAGPGSPGGNSTSGYAATFVETGLPAGTEWTVRLAGPSANPSPVSGPAPAIASAWSHGLTNSSNTSTIGFSLANGSYRYWVLDALNGTTVFAPSPSSGSLAMNGSAVSVSVTFTRLSVYPVSFVESGLPAGTTWSVELCGSGTVTPLPNGSAGPSPAWHGGSWNSSNGTTVNFSVPNGNYTFFVPSTSGPVGLYVPTPSFGAVVVNGSGVTVEVTFVTIPYYDVSFVETGLPAGTNWSVVLLGGRLPGPVGNGSGPEPLCGVSQFNSSNTSTVNFTVPNGSYVFSVGNVSSPNYLYVPSPAFGNLTVSGSAVKVEVRFTSVPVYEVTFAETGLPAGTNWSVELFNWSSGWFWNGSANTTLNFTVPNGTYGFSIGNASNATMLYVPTPANGTLTVRGGPVTVPVHFTGVELYTVSFTETGLPAGTNWSVVLLNGSSGWAWNGSSNSTINFSVANGSYLFSVSGGWGVNRTYVPTPARGMVTVDGANVVVPISFALLVLYSVTFVESGLPNGTSWYVALEGGWGIWSFGASNNTSVSFLLTNGTVEFSIGPTWASGVFYVPTPSYGTVSVAGAAVTVDVSFAPA